MNLLFLTKCAVVLGSAFCGVLGVVGGGGVCFFFFFFNDTATTEIYTLSLHDALPICLKRDTKIQTITKRVNLC